MSDFECTLNLEADEFPHFWEHTVGSGHAVLALRADYQQQLKRAHQELGFNHVRFHGILSDDVGTLTCQNNQLIDSFFNADKIFDFLLSIGMKPFVELSFMPQTLASDASQTVFHYRGVIAPPKNLKVWGEFISRLVRHWLDRYGIDEVSNWFFEVWNEPNLKAFWTGSQADYFRLYDETARAVKDVHPSLKVGGPATAHNGWIDKFIEHCETKDTPIDFISTHHYPTDDFGKPGDDTLSQLAASQRSILREQVRETKKKAAKLPVYYTEWCTSSNPFDELHDAPYAAAFIAKTVMEARGAVEGYSYWTFTDLFEENYFSSVPFHGGFGLMNIHGIPKPSYRAFELLHQLGSKIHKVKGCHSTVDVFVTTHEQITTVLIVNSALPRHEIGEELVSIQLNDLPHVSSATVRRIDDKNANAPAHWRAMGKPDYLTSQQVEELEAASLSVSNQLSVKQDQKIGGIGFALSVSPQSVALVTLTHSEKLT
jgi:xylan 1,4-beta-xylosidase